MFTDENRNRRQQMEGTPFYFQRRKGGGMFLRSLWGMEFYLAFRSGFQYNNNLHQKRTGGEDDEDTD